MLPRALWVQLRQVVLAGFHTRTHHQFVSIETNPLGRGGDGGPANERQRKAKNGRTVGALRLSRCHRDRVTSNLNRKCRRCAKATASPSSRTRSTPAHGSSTARWTRQLKFIFWVWGMGIAGYLTNKTMPHERLKKGRNK